MSNLQENCQSNNKKYQHHKEIEFSDMEIDFEALDEEVQTHSKQPEMEGSSNSDTQGISTVDSRKSKMNNVELKNYSEESLFLNHEVNQEVVGNISKLDNVHEVNSSQSTKRQSNQFLCVNREKSNFQGKRFSQVKITDCFFKK